jgi:hypothetical protein
MATRSQQLEAFGEVFRLRSESLTIHVWAGCNFLQLDQLRTKDGNLRLDLCPLFSKRFRFVLSSLGKKSNLYIGICIPLT